MKATAPRLNSGVTRIELSAVAARGAHHHTADRLMQYLDRKPFTVPVGKRKPKAASTGGR
jgi:hypothetical protein